jgi:hypothetical protein
MQKRNPGNSGLVEGSVPRARLAVWQLAWLAVAVLSFAAVAYHGYQAIQDTNRDLRVQLIQRHNLWEVDKHYKGSPQDWTRFAAWLLNTEQLMQRVEEKYGTASEEIQKDFERDTAFALTQVIAFHAILWGAPIGALYLLGWLYARRRTHP